MTDKRMPAVLLFLFISSLCLPTALALEPLWTYPTGDAEIGGVDVSSDGSVIVVAAGKVWVFSKGGNLTEKEPFADNVVMTSDGKYVASTYSSTMYFFKVQSSAGIPGQKNLEKIWEYSFSDQARSIDLSDDGKIILVATVGKGLFFFNTWTKKVYPNNKNYNAVIRLAPNGRMAVGIALDGVRRYSTSAGVYPKKSITINAEPHTMLLANTGWAALFNDGQKVRYVNTYNGTEIWSTQVTGYVTSLAWPSSGSSIIVGTESGNLYRLNTTGKIIWQNTTNPTKKQQAGIEGIAASKTGDPVAIITGDDKVLIFNADGDQLSSYQAKDSLQHIAMSSDGSIAVVTGEKAIYAFSLNYKSKPTTKTTTVSPDISEPEEGPEEEPVEDLTTEDLDPSSTSVSGITPTGTVTDVPTEYSIIRKSTQSPLPAMTGIAAILLIALFGSRKNLR